VDKSVRKRIALLLGQAEEYSQTLFIEGFLSEAFANDADVFIFSTYIKYQNTPQREVGECSIFDLPNWDMFDAAVVMADTIQTPGAVDKIEEDLHMNFDGEVIFIEKESKYFRTYRMDNYTSVKKLIDHLIDVHGYRDIAFLTGKSWHPHSQIRLQAYKDSMEEHGITPDEDRIFYGDFWYTSGESLADTLLGSDRALPRAVACANDCMALGLARVLTRKGLNIPGDIAVIGYDTNEEGQHAPVPLTSAPVPMKQFGKYAADSVMKLLSGKEPVPFTADVDLFIGGSCGCGCDSAKPEYYKRDKWETDLSRAAVFSLFNNMDDDLLSQNSFTGLVSSIFSYVYQIRDFEYLYICLNSDLADGTSLGKASSTFTEKMIPVIRCGPEGFNQDHLDLKSNFATRDMLPEYSKDRDHPAAFFFMPLNFDDHVFGYSVISYPKPVSLNSEYRAWLKSVSRGIEYYRRSDEIVRSNAILETGIVRDNLTGLYNYQGFVKQAGTFISTVKNNGGCVGVLVADIRSLAAINREFGRAEGDKAIITAAGFLDGTFRSRTSMCLSIGNGELVAVKPISDNSNSEILDLRDEFLARIDEYNSTSDAGYDLDVYCAIEIGSPDDVDDLERMVNIAISRKNNLKIASNKIDSEESLNENEMEEARRVQSILDDGRILYHFQPIVRSDTGKIFAYEALMRPDADRDMSPLTVLRYAEYFDRLYDVEKATFENVLRLIRENKENIAPGVKIFINSIPGHMLKSEDMSALRNALDRRPDSIVVELTEHAQLTDDELDDLKSRLAKEGVQIAVDDYGTGYSNVTNLLRYMPDYVKIDRQLMSGIQDSPQKQHFVRDIIEFSHDNGIMALAEGVETEEELLTVISLGADLVQGYYIAPPRKGISKEVSQEAKEAISRNALRHRYSGSVYNAGDGSRIDLANLAGDDIKKILINSNLSTIRELTICGMPSVTIPMDIEITDGYQGRITLENVDIEQKAKGAPSISISGGSDVKIVLHGANYLDGGIRVEEGSKVSFEGEGFLSVSARNECCYAIGNDFESRHGDLAFNQDGTITIRLDARECVGIGSGLGGHITIRRGKYLLGLKGRSSVGLGSGKGPADLKLSDCYIDLEYQGRYGIGIGSMSNIASIDLKDVRFKSIFTGEVLTGVGSLLGDSADISIKDAYLNISGRGAKFCGIGLSSECCDGADITICNAGVSVNAEGAKALAIGSFQLNSKLDVKQASFTGNIVTGLKTSIGIDRKGSRQSEVTWEIK